ncbi:MAG: Dna2/Cas4 domain-containing protein [Nanopusillaceae archaeon]
MHDVDEVVVNKWIFRYLLMYYKSYGDDEITVTEAVNPCLRKSYLTRVKMVQPTPMEFLKVVGQDIHVALQDILRREGWDVEVGVALRLDGFVLRGRVDAAKDDVILEFKTTNGIPERPYESHQLQIQAYLTMMNASKGYIIYLSRTDGKVKVFKIHPSKGSLKKVIGRAKQLHEALKSNQPPPPSRGPWCEYCSFKLACRR